MNPSRFGSRLTLTLALSLVVNGWACWSYYRHGYSGGMEAAWVVSLVVLAAVLFADRVRVASTLNRKDLLVVLCLLYLFTPLYCLFLYNIPYQMYTDETCLTDWTRTVMRQSPQDPFGLGTYASYPNLIFMVYGRFCQWMGDINFYHMRLVNAVSGLLVIVLSYLFFRKVAFKHRRPALLAAVILGSNHAMVAISRMALWETTAEILAIPAWILLYRGYETRCRFRSFIGGCLAGACYYAYYPGKIAIIVWFFFLLCVAVFKREKGLRSLACYAGLGFLLVYGPLLIATLFRQGNFMEATQYQRSQLLIGAGYPALKENVVNALTMFNKPLPSTQTYYNYGHGFLDPLTGVLLWVGLLGVLWKRGREPRVLLMTGSFFLIWMVMMFLVNYAPGYTRLLIMLPMIAYFVVEVLEALAEAVRKRAETQGKHIPWLPSVVVLLPVLMIVGWNLKIFGDHIRWGKERGDEVGGTVRYMDARRGYYGYAYYLVTDPSYRYFTFSPNLSDWRYHVNFYAGPGQSVQMLDSKDLLTRIGSPPLTVFISKELWLRHQPEFERRFHSIHATPIRRVWEETFAIEILS